MKKYAILIFGALLFGAMTLGTSCSRKSGCPATESLQPKTNRKGELKTKRKPDNGLFSKKMSKKMH